VSSFVVSAGKKSQIEEILRVHGSVGSAKTAVRIIFFVVKFNVDVGVDVGVIGGVVGAGNVALHVVVAVVASASLQVFDLFRQSPNLVLKKIRIWSRHFFSVRKIRISRRRF
jgi:hypothetical protein